ncbi:MAG: acylneuraminate cytidylyltransferase family protein [Verrucomicrobia bacterium]|jgi:CMP-N,N'-diacetyllegionaminic acid synthase|nr:MAG: acylneuraminate cytidylyltransferase family protein [Verrucomicrobiota bacterium]
MRIAALIPARGGSKGIPRKNLVPLAGKPLIAWTIEAALGSDKLSRVLVSTDDAEIAAVARQYGAEVPFLRPPELARDETGTLEVALHALDWIEQNTTDRPEYLLLLQPTSPLRTTADIAAAIHLAQTRGADAVLGVCEAEPHPYLARRMDESGVLSDFIPAREASGRRQDFPPAYILNGALYLNRCTSLRASRVFQPPGALAHVMPRERSLDIDTPDDLRLAELLLTK